MKNRIFQAFGEYRPLLCLPCAVLLMLHPSALAQNSTIFGSNVYVVTPSDSISLINSTLASLAGNGQFDTQRYAVLFAPGTYTGVESEVCFHESIDGLGEPPAPFISIAAIYANRLNNHL
jgi:hypothetical protein